MRPDVVVVFFLCLIGIIVFMNVATTYAIRAEKQLIKAQRVINDHAKSGLSIVESDTGMTELALRELMKDPEGERLEFKQNLLRPNDITDYAVAIGNEGGGWLLLGVTNTKPRRVSGIPFQSNGDLQRIRRSVCDSASIHVDPHLIETGEGFVLAIRIPARLPGQLFHTNTGKYLMRSGEDLRGMTPVEIAAVLKETDVGFY